MLDALADTTLLMVNGAKRANALYRAGEFGRAADVYLHALEVRRPAIPLLLPPRSPSLLLPFFVHSLLCWQLASAAPDACHPVDVATLHFNCARAALKEGRHVLALAQAELALAQRADYANARMLQAECAMELLEFDLAATACAAHTQISRQISRRKSRPAVLRAAGAKLAPPS